MGAVTKAAKERQKQYRAELVKWYKDNGLCQRCKSWVEPGRTLCVNCLKKVRQHAKQIDPTGEMRRAKSRDRRARLKALGICIDCGKRTAEPNKSRCKICNQKARDSRIKYNIHQRTLAAQNTPPQIEREGWHNRKGG